MRDGILVQEGDTKNRLLDEEVHRKIWLLPRKKTNIPSFQIVCHTLKINVIYYEK